MKQIKNIVKKINHKSIIKLLVVTMLVIILCSISIYLQRKEKDNIKINEKELKSEHGKVKVYLSGAVNSPGIYSFDEGTVLEEALNIIGGIKSDADITKVNLSKVLYDSEKVVIPYIQEETEELSDNSKDITDNEKININEDNEDQLRTLPGIGDATAKKIIEYRKNGDFETIEDIKNVSGIGDSKFEKIKDKITVE